MLVLERDEKMELMKESEKVLVKVPALVGEEAPKTVLEKELVTATAMVERWAPGLG